MSNPSSHFFIPQVKLTDTTIGEYTIYNKEPTNAFRVCYFATLLDRHYYIVGQELCAHDNVERDLPAYVAQLRGAKRSILFVEHFTCDNNDSLVYFVFEMRARPTCLLSTVIRKIEETTSHLSTLFFAMLMRNMEKWAKTLLNMYAHINTNRLFHALFNPSNIIIVGDNDDLVLGPCAMRAIQFSSPAVAAAAPSSLPDVYSLTIYSKFYLPCMPDTLKLNANIEPNLWSLLCILFELMTHGMPLVSKPEEFALEEVRTCLAKVDSFFLSLIYDFAIGTRNLTDEMNPDVYRRLDAELCLARNGIFAIRFAQNACAAQAPPQPPQQPSTPPQPPQPSLASSSLSSLPPLPPPKIILSKQDFGVLKLQLRSLTNTPQLGISKCKWEFSKSSATLHISFNPSISLEPDVVGRALHSLLQSKFPSVKFSHTSFRTNKQRNKFSILYACSF